MKLPNVSGCIIMCISAMDWLHSCDPVELIAS